MKIGLQTWGSEGDFRPFQALARGLSAAGHEVTIAYTDVSNSIRAQDYAARLKKENGVAKAISLLEHYYTKQGQR